MLRLIFWVIILDAISVAEFTLTNGLAGDVFEISRKFITQAKEDIAMQAYYKNINLSEKKFNVTWFYENNKLDKNSRGKFRFGNEGTQLQIIGVEIEDGGIYKCNISTARNEMFLTVFQLIVEREPLPMWAIILIIVALLLLLIGTAIYFRCKSNITDMVARNKPRRKRKTISETSFQE